MSHRLGIVVIDCINIYAVPLHRVCADSCMLFRVKTKANLYASNFFVGQVTSCILRILSRRRSLRSSRMNKYKKYHKQNNLKFDVPEILRV